MQEIFDQGPSSLSHSRNNPKKDFIKRKGLRDYPQPFLYDTMDQNQARRKTIKNKGEIYGKNNMRTFCGRRRIPPGL